MKYQVVYYSETGNTEKIAKAIFECLPGEDKDIQRLGEYKGDADMYFLGFWVNQGSASMDFLDFLASLEGKKIALFSTCGVGDNPNYHQQIEAQLEAWLPDNCDYRGLYVCQGKMPITVRKRYEDMNKGEDGKAREEMIRNFDRALLHPDNEDIAKVKEFVKAAIQEGKKK